MRSLCKFFAVAAAVLIVGCGGGRQIVIISTNDTHSAIDMFPQLATLVDSIRRENRHVLLLHAGDWSTGNPYADLYPQRGYPNIALMNALRYDLATLGNHEFDNGVDTLAARLGQAGFPIVLANINANGAIPQPELFRTINMAGIKLGFLGLITVTSSGYPDGFVSSFGAATFEDPIATAGKFAFLADSVDVFIGLTHIGYECDSLLALAVPELDLIVGGHSHTVLDGGGRKVNETLITQTGAKLRYAGVTTLNFDRNGNLLSMENKLVNLSMLAADPEIVAMVAKFKSESEFGRQVGEAADYFNKNAVMSLYADALRKGTGADIAVANRGGVRVDYLNPGPVTAGDIFMTEPFGNKAVVVEMTRQQLETMIQNKFNDSGDEGRSIELWPSGFGYTVATADDGTVGKITLNMPVHKTRYKVAMSDYVNSAYDFALKGKGESPAIPITELIGRFIAAHSPVQPDPSERASVKYPPAPVE